jgi:3',5'-cyclic AMP phosphodiesterase CpdA
MIRLVHVSDFHFDDTPELRSALDRLVEAVVGREPDAVIVTGDLSAGRRPRELDAVAVALERIRPIPLVVIPGNRDLEPSIGPPGEARPLPVDSDLDYFLALEPALSFGFGEADEADADGEPEDTPEAAFERRFGGLDAELRDARLHVVAVNSSPRLRAAALERAARRMRRAAPGALRVFALHHGLLPVPGRKVRDGDLAHRAGDIVALLCDLQVDLALHGHVHRAHAWQVSDGRHSLVVASAGALVNDGRRDASLLEILAGDGRLEIWRRSVATGKPSLLFEGACRPGVG